MTSLLHLDSPLVLGSSSASRQKQMREMGLAFTIIEPNIDEQAMSGETGHDLVLRLAQAKAKAVALKAPNSWIVSGDQVLVCQGRIYGKPHTRSMAKAQLSAFSQKRAVYYNGLCLYHAKHGIMKLDCVQTTVVFKALTPAFIDAYLVHDGPLQSAGSIKLEAMGLMLIESINSPDPFAVLGLPMLTLCGMFYDVSQQISAAGDAPP